LHSLGTIELCSFFFLRGGLSRSADRYRSGVLRYRDGKPDFAEFYRGAADECLRTGVISGDQDTAQELVDEAFARAWSSWRTVSRHPAPKRA
jgi:hypothetical protein